MKPDWTSKCGTIQLYNADCRDVLPFVKCDAVITDPPYGIDYDASESTQTGITKHDAIAGDDQPFDPSHLLGFRDVLTWGANNYAHLLPPGEGQWYCWDKVTANNLNVRIAEYEYAWHKRGTKPRGFRHLWSGAYKASERDEPRVHPNQKPVALLEWCLGLVDGRTVFDPYMGSGTTGVACARLDRRFIGIELDPKHFATAVSRITAELSRAPLFTPPTPNQTTMFEDVQT